ncbi:NAD-dependent succinate-semialdehyde dehydrogenase [uncultured Sphingomonas sp.]|uniref:NAD-dependent succinate-semialdehyde dehydrogenase n=1 Tax=uncultured Sphingomonas sp. TaxID=158754 RepID=UPI0025D7B13D|nr:NAD-dependent succinate-semialdehyde dehydrogenase [uncultured Sphingomonas sp.]
MYTELSLCIDGRFMSAGSGRLSEPVSNPATGAVLGELPHATVDELDEAVAAAARAFPGWAATSPFERSAILRQAAGLLRDRVDALAAIMTLEQGKPIAESKGELIHAIELIEWLAEEGRRTYGRVVPSRSPGTLEHLVLREPVGVCAAFTPWNFPALTPVRKLGAALAAGCTVILKASEETPGCAVEIVRALHEAGLPAGCAQLVFGVPSEVSERLIAAPEVRKISFTGSTPVGEHLMALAARGAKRTTMELGGNAPVIVFSDADYMKALATLAAGKFRNAGQVCVSPARFFVHESLYNRFVSDVAAHARGLRLGDGLDPATQMGPLANARRVEAMEAFVANAERGGATLVAGGKRQGNNGMFFEPTVIAANAPDIRLFREECFGPILPVMPFSTVKEAIELANGTAAGLAGYAFTRGVENRQVATHRLRVGLVGINTLAISAPETPFGGVGESGFGSEGGSEGLDAYLQTKLASISA